MKLPTYIAVIWAILAITATPTWANPYFYFGSIQSEDNGSGAIKKIVGIYLNTDSSPLTAAQTVMNYDSSIFTGTSLSILGSKCSFWAPADPALGYGNQSTPYFNGGNKAVLSCGFSNPGYTSANQGDLIATVTLTPIASGSTTISFDSSKTKFYYINQTITPGAMLSEELFAVDSTKSATPKPTPKTTPKSNNAPPPTPYVFTEKDLNFTQMGESQNSVNSVLFGTDSPLTVVDENDEIPPAPSDLEKRVNNRPLWSSLLNKNPEGESENLGDVLSAQSLKELLIPGKSKADKTVVMTNLVSTLSFIAILAILIWRLIVTSRINRIKSQHMTEMIQSELAVLESKLGSNNDTIKQELNAAIGKLSKEL